MIVTRPTKKALRSPIFVYGPQGCGKTQQAEALRVHFGLTHVVDDWQPSDPPPRAGALVLTHQAPPPGQLRWVLSFDEAMARLQGPEGYPF